MSRSKQKNLAAVLVRQKKPLSVNQLDIPEIPPGYVLVKMIYSGICHTQLNEINGSLGKDKYLPHCLGHEGVGKIIKLSSTVKKFKKNDNVCISWIKKNSKKKYQPFSYKYKGKKINSGGCNTLSSHSIVSENRIFKMDKKNNHIRESILLGCAIPTAESAISQHPKITKDSKVLIMGMGGLGFSCLFVLNYLNCKNIFCLDKNPKRLRIINSFKNCNTIMSTNKNLKNFILKNKETFDLVLDCTGSKSLIQIVLQLCKNFSGRYIFIGNTGINDKILIKSWDIINSKTLTGAWPAKGVIMKNFKKTEKILLNQISNIKKILPKKNYKLKNINNAIEDFKLGKILRPIIKF